MRVLITGASGFIGSTIIPELNRLGFEVNALLRKTSSVSNLVGLKYNRVEGDLGDLDSLRRAVKGMDCVFHLAGATAALDRASFFRHNAEGTARLAQAVAEESPGLSRFVHVSSLAASGPSAMLAPRLETDLERPVSAYGESKFQGERELLKYKGTFPVCIVRPPIVYGPRDKGVFVMIKAVSRRLMPLLPSSRKDGNKYYSVIHAEDLCAGMIQAATASRQDVPSGEVFFLAGDGVHTYQDMMLAMAKSLKRTPIRIRVPRFGVIAAAAGCSALGYLTGKTLTLNLDKINELLPDYWICSNEKAKQKLGFSPKYDLERGISHAVAWYQREGWI